MGVILPVSWVSCLSSCSRQVEANIDSKKKYSCNKMSLKNLVFRNKYEQIRTNTQTKNCIVAPTCQNHASTLLMSGLLELRSNDRQCVKNSYNACRDSFLTMQPVFWIRIRFIWIRTSLKWIQIRIQSLFYPPNFFLLQLLNC